LSFELNTKTAYIGLGSNLGDRREYIDKALKMLVDTSNSKIIGLSDIIETNALGDSNQPDYLNAVARIETILDVHSLHKALINIENALGRERPCKWAARTIDIDLLLFDNQIIRSTSLTVPHPQMHLRSFVLRGLCQLDAWLEHPVMKLSVSELAERLNGGDFAIASDKPHLISLAGNIGVGKTTLAKKLASLLGGEILFEPYDTNPFMPEVYAGKKELALDSQLFFLTNRTQQLGRDNLKVGNVYISDYIFEKETIYADALLESRQLALYKQIYPPFALMVSTPMLVIYLEDSAEDCLNRIHRRGRPYEQKIELQFLRRLDRDYQQLFTGWKKSPLIRVKTSQLDYADASIVENIAAQINYYIRTD
jgi:deoxyguanosine kinase